LNSVLTDARATLAELGFRMVSNEPTEWVFVRDRWYLDGLTNARMVVSVRAVDSLSGSILDVDARGFAARLGELESRSWLGKLLGVRVGIRIYLATSIDTSAAAMLQRSPRWHWRSITVLAARDQSGQVFRIRTSPPWFVSLFPKYTFVIQRLLEPGTSPVREPISWSGALVTVVVASLAVMLVVLGLR